MRELLINAGVSYTVNLWRTVASPGFSAGGGARRACATNQAEITNFDMNIINIGKKMNRLGI